jgi:hypothetical protein
VEPSEARGMPNAPLSQWTILGSIAQPIIRPVAKAAYAVMRVLMARGLRFLGELDDHSQIVRFVSSFIGDGFVGKVRSAAFMAVVLHAYAVLVQQK